MDKQNYLSQLLRRNEQAIEQAEQLLHQASRKQLLQAPKPGKWNAIECFAHLNLANAHYLPAMRKCLSAPPLKSAGTSSFTSGWFGGWFARMMQANGQGKVSFAMKTFDRFIPTDLPSDSTPLNHFITELRELHKLMEAAKSRDISRIKLPSAVGSWLQFRLGDAFAFVVNHNERHLLQALRAANPATESPEIQATAIG